MTPKVLLYDIECSPVVAHIWGLRDLNVGLSQVVADPEVLGVGFKWFHSGKPAKYLSVNRLGREEMLSRTWDLMDQADVVVGYNNTGFDDKWVSGEFARIGLTPPSPYKSLDLFRIAKARFRFPSHKLQYVSTALGMEGKLETGGHGLWVKVMEGDPAADRKMGRYCARDVELLEPLLEKLLPWAGSQINFALWSEHGAEIACQKCGGENLKRRGYAYTATAAFPQFRCDDCGGWTRGTKREYGTGGAGVAL